MQGKDKGTYKGVAEFLDFLASLRLPQNGTRKRATCQSPKPRMT
jgi:hypothetical protein